MAEKKNQHYVPKFYFRYFNDRTSFISVYLLKQNKIIVSTSVADQSSKDYFYGDADVEEKVCLVENRLRDSIEEVARIGELNKRLRSTLTEYLLYQDARTSKKRAETINAYRTIEAMADLHRKAKTIEDAKLWHKENSPNEFTPDEKKWHWRFMLHSLKSIWVFEDLTCVLLRNRTQIPYVFSDSPVVFMNPHMSDFAEKGIIGIMSKGLIAAFPLNPEYCVLFYDPNVYRLSLASTKLYDKVKSVLEVSESDVEIINSLQYFNAENCVYSSDKLALHRIEKLERRPPQPAEYICAIDAVTDTTDLYTLKFHGTLQNVAKFPDLPFLEYVKSKRFVLARPRPFKKYQARIKERQRNLRDPSFLRSLKGLDFEQMARAMQI